VTLLFAMNDLFERYVAVQLRRALAGTPFEVVAQGGFAYCLGPWNGDGPVVGNTHPTRPDLLIRHGGRVVAILDTKWKDPAKASHTPICTK
jgi:5-methylcytosine-specific restriction enzyme subunit McrC